MATKLNKTYTDFVQETKYLSTSDAVMIITDHWVFLHIEIRGVTYAYRDSAWEATIRSFPTDVTLDVPMPGGYNQFNPSVDGMSEAHIENGVFTNQERSSGFSSTGHEGFLYFFAVRNTE